jgi:hypothetical protein
LIADNLAVEWKYSRLFPQALNCASSAFLADALLWFLQFLSLLDCITLCVCPSCDFGRKSRSLGKLYEAPGLREDRSLHAPPLPVFIYTWERAVKWRAF